MPAATQGYSSSKRKKIMNEHTWQGQASACCAPVQEEDTTDGNISTILYREQ